ncbi:MAG: hypothetical protein IH604_13200 [Burkholderiales bacterium]|nr:hypothetical protein [Burkholderiales bacterium]
MSNDLRIIKEHVYKVFARCGAIPKDADIVLGNKEGWQTMVQCTWKPPAPTELGGGKTTRTIMLQLTGVATKRFLDADELLLSHLDAKLADIVQNRLRQGYKESETEASPFVIELDEHDFDD